MKELKHAIPEADRPKLDPSQAAAPAWAKDLIVDEATGAILSPGNPEICQGNGFHVNVDGDAIECACDECDYLQLCFPEEQTEHTHV